MKLSWLMFALLLAMCIVLAVTAAVNELPNSHGVDHAGFAAMQQGGLPARHDGVVWLGWAFGLLQVAFIVCCLSLGLRNPGRQKWVFALCAGLYAMTFSFLVAADRLSSGSPSPLLVLSFPLPTAIMLYGLGAAPLMFTVLYVVKFDRWILTPEDMQRFDQLVQEKTREGNGG